MRGWQRDEAQAWQGTHPLQDVQSCALDVLGVCGHAGGQTEVCVAATARVHHGCFPDSAGSRERGQSRAVFQSASPRRSAVLPPPCTLPRAYKPWAHPPPSENTACPPLTEPLSPQPGKTLRGRIPSQSPALPGATMHDVPLHGGWERCLARRC